MQCLITFFFLNVPEEKPIEVEEEEEEVQKTPGNLLDNLFRKTKTVPCLYWMPLSDDQVCRPHPPTPTTSYPPPPAPPTHSSLSPSRLCLQKAM